MTPDAYDAWYETPRGRWIGETEYRLLRRRLEPPSGSSILDVGCGTGYFGRRLAADGFEVTGIDTDAATIDYACSRATSRERYQIGDARNLAFPDRHFDYSVAIASLCFIREQERALREMARVTRKRIALGLLNRHSLLYWQKGRGGGHGAYRGAVWHMTREARALLKQAGLERITVRFAITLPDGGWTARCVESLLPSCFAFGGFLLVVGDIA